MGGGWSSSSIIVLVVRRFVDTSRCTDAATFAFKAELVTAIAAVRDGQVCCCGRCTVHAADVGRGAVWCVCIAGGLKPDPVVLASERASERANVREIRATCEPAALTCACLLSRQGRCPVDSCLFLRKVLIEDLEWSRSTTTAGRSLLAWQF